MLRRSLAAMLVVRRCVSLAAKHRVVVVGGTHGNEYTGVWLEKALRDKSETIVGNPAAVEANRRFLDEDLNRCFLRSKLDAPPETREALRAREVDAALGPKGSDTAADLVIDLHTTTANMGVTMICDAWCPFALRAAVYVKQQLDDQLLLGQDVKIMYNDEKDKENAPYLASVGKAGLQIEVGPTPQGVVRWDVVDATKRALDAVLDLWNKECRGECVSLPDEIDVYSVAEGFTKLSWPVDDDGFPAAVPHESIQDRDWSTLKKGDPLWRDRDGATVPYDGSFGDEIVPIFVNEGGYYYASSGRGIGVAQKRRVAVPPASP